MRFSGIRGMGNHLSTRASVVRERQKGLGDWVASMEATSILDGLDPDSWRVVAWRRGARGVLRKLRARMGVYRVGYRGTHLTSAGWLTGERSTNGRPTETKHYFASGMDRMSLDDIVELAHCRWIIEHFYQDAKGEVGLDD